MVDTTHLSEQEKELIRKLYSKYGCTLTSLVMNISKKTIVTHTKDLSNPSREDVNSKIVQLIVEREFE